MVLLRRMSLSLALLLAGALLAAPAATAVPSLQNFYGPRPGKVVTPEQISSVMRGKKPPPPSLFRRYLRDGDQIRLLGPDLGRAGFFMATFTNKDDSFSLVTPSRWRTFKASGKVQVPGTIYPTLELQRDSNTGFVFGIVPSKYVKAYVRYPDGGRSRTVAVKRRGFAVNVRTTADELVVVVKKKRGRAFRQRFNLK